MTVSTRLWECELLERAQPLFEPTRIPVPLYSGEPSGCSRFLALCARSRSSAIFMIRMRHARPQPASLHLITAADRPELVAAALGVEERQERAN